MTPVAGTQSPATHHVTLATDTDTQGFMLVPGTYRGPERLNDFAPRIAAGSETALREDLWDIWSQDEARGGIDQYTFQNKNRIYRSDGNVFFGRKQAITLQAIAASSDAAKAATTPMLIESGTNIVLVGVGTKVRRYNVSGASWSDSTTTLGASAIWLHRHGSTDYCALGTANDMVSSTNNGDTWAADTVSFRFNGLATFQGLLYCWNGATRRPTSPTPLRPSGCFSSAPRMACSISTGRRSCPCAASASRCTRATSAWATTATALPITTSRGASRRCRCRPAP